jgi:hypothetical protein
MSKFGGFGTTYWGKQNNNIGVTKKAMANSSKIATTAKMSATKQQAIRTGGWANPSKGGESKFVDQLSQATILTPSDSSFIAPKLINGIASGSSASQRIGRKVTVTKVSARGTWRMNAASTGGSPLRVVIFYDKQSNGALATETDMMNEDTYHSFNNLSNRDRFVVLADVFTDPISLNANANSHTWKVNWKGSLEMVFNQGTDSSIGSIQSGAIYIMFAQTGDIAGASGPDVTWASRVRYTDV